MIRYFYLLGLWSCLALPALVKADTETQANATYSSQNSHFAPTDDWDLPSFVAKNPSDVASTHADKSKHKESSSRAHDSSVAHSSKPTPAAVPSSSAKHDVASSSPASSVKRDSAASRPDSKHDSASSTASSKGNLPHAIAQAVASTAHAAEKAVVAGQKGLMGRLARLTAYWAGEGDYYTGKCVSSTGIHLHGGHCAVDPSIIPYGSVVVIPGVGQFLAVDTGSAVISRAAAREAGHTSAERSALVIDLFFEHSWDGERFAANGAKFVSISWFTPSSTEHAARAARSVFADEDWNKIYSKQL